MHYLSPLLRKLLGEAMRHRAIRERDAWVSLRPGRRAASVPRRNQKEKKEFNKDKKSDAANQHLAPGIITLRECCALSIARKSSGSIDHFPAADIVRASVAPSGTALSFIRKREWGPVLLNNYYIPGPQARPVLCSRFHSNFESQLGEVGRCVR